jgi:LDH2 family malate/lactate/ureidoglycolate dehydrogenase
VSATVIRRYRLDDLRRFAAALGSASGLEPPRALALASHLLWFDAVGATSFGIETLPCWLEKIEAGSIDLSAVGKINAERPSLATIDGQNGIAPLVLEQAAEIAIEKARDTAVAFVRIAHLGGLVSAAPVVAAMAVRPVAGLVLGPGGLWSAAVPSQSGEPIVFDRGLASLAPGQIGAVARERAGRQVRPAKQRAPRLASPAPDGVGNWRGILVPEESWLVAAISLAELEPLSEFREQVGEWISSLTDGPGRVQPASWTDRHSEAHERGVAIAPPAWKKLKHWANRFAVAVPSPGRS